VTTCAFIGDEVSAAGFRLAGATVYGEQDGEPDALFRRLRDQHELLILSAEAADRVSHEQLQQAAELGHPLVLVVPDAGGRMQPPDLAARVREQLGMSE
jgi:vacuolar-type H+-ATPase subunit F/Vma7